MGIFVHILSSRYIHLYPAGSTCGTLSDLATFVKAFLSDGRNCPLFEKEDTLDEMLTPSKYFSDGKTPCFYHGFMIEKAGMAEIQKVSVRLYGSIRKQKQALL